MTSTAPNAPAPASTEPVIDSHQVGMMFVHEYYTFLNKEPSRLHCFYNKQSTMSHGYQGDDPHICYVQRALDIHTKILDLDFEDCKVLVSNVDSQSSMNGGIMIQVLGYMSNKGGPSQKFAQTFFLAQQPKGYYVLNDIFRYLKEDSELEDDSTAELPEAEVEADAVVDVVAEEAVVVEEVASVTEAASAEITLVKDVKVEVVEVEEKKPVVEEKKPVEKKAENKKHDKKSEKKEAKKDEAKETKKEVKKEGDSSEKSKAPESSKKQQNSAPVATATPVAEPSQEETPAPAPADAAPAPAPVDTPVAAPAPVPAEPPKPKTWANLAANNSGQWGSHANSAVKGTSINVAQPAPKPQSPQPSTAQAHNKPQGQRPSSRDEVHGIYVKNITERMSIEQLREVFSKFGPVKNLELTAKKNCAYVDFETVEAVQAALKQNKVNVGSEVVLAEERHRPGFQSGGRPFHYQNGNGPNGHQGPQGGRRGGRPSRGGYQDRKSIQRPDKAAATVAVN
ncbi:hypothetical protein BGZ79_003075 [Entomortierella chlamydospora]|nr:hypothetical protein BGZ79_003075 [Entomortierella chlamydospora]